MSTIERALEKQRQLAENKRLLEQQQEALKAKISIPENTEEPRSITDKSYPEPSLPHSIPPKEDAPTAVLMAPDVSAEPEAVNALKPAKEPQTSEEPKTVEPEQGSKGSQKWVHIDIERLESMGMVSPTENFSQIKEEYRYIKRPLLNNAFGPGAVTLDQPNLVMVSSSYSGEGKTFTTINLAISMAMEEDRQVLLVDADVIKPSICSRLGIEEQPGLIDYLTGNVEVADIIINTNIENLKLITSGKRHHHSNELIASEKMQRFMLELSERYPDRIVIFDTSPLLGASETNVLAQMTGQAVIVVEEKKTSHGQLQHALSLLNQNMAIGLVLNKSNGRKDNYGYYYAKK